MCRELCFGLTKKFLFALQVLLGCCDGVFSGPEEEAVVVCHGK